VEGTTDVYSYLQAPLLASGRLWSPRPIFQSYQAYTPELVRLNADHLRGDRAPDNIAFRVEPIDNRLPALDDGLSWPLLMRNYSLTGNVDAFIYLKKKKSPPEDRPATEIYSGEHMLGSDVSVPETNEPVFAEIDVQPTLLGRLWTILYKPPDLQIFVSLANGRKMTYRFIRGIAKAGFVISPLVEDGNDFIALNTADRDALTTKRVKSFALSPVGGASLFWSNRYSVRLSTLDSVLDIR
jgi:hypothetical protein